MAPNHHCNDPNDRAVHHMSVDDAQLVLLRAGAAIGFVYSDCAVRHVELARESGDP
jgi:hypothetical protein